MSKTLTNIYESCPPTQLTFNEVISRRTAYGLIWLGHYYHHLCVVKMIMLTTGVHYDKNNKEYRTAQNRPMTELVAGKYFNHNDNQPYFHMDFRHRRSMTPDAFFKEIDDLINLSKMGIAPKVFGYGINRTYPIHYGFIVMEKVDCSLKDIYLKRDLNMVEGQIIKDLIDHMHDVHGIIHGDLKPSNVGVYLDEHGHVKNACLFDCQKNRHRENMTPENFRRSANREAENFKKHIIMNKDEGQKIPPKLTKTQIEITNFI